MNLWEQDIAALHSLLEKREISAVELLEAALERIQQVEPKVHAYLSLSQEYAGKQARQADESFKRKENLHFLTGIPLALKDNLCFRNHPTTCASRMLENFIPPYDATVVERLEQAGAVFLGKTNMDEFAMGSSTEHSAFGVTCNPWDLERVPGGSSGGSAAAVAAGEAIAALGSDTGGSIRLPASFCGVVGLKPTYGLVSRYGLIAYASSLDQIGPMTRTVADAAKILECIGGYDPRDSTSAKIQIQELPDFSRLEKPVENGFQGLVCGISAEFLGEGLNPEVKEVVLQAGKTLESLGARIEEVSLPSLPYAVAAYYLIASAEASSNLARYDGTRYGLRVSSATTKTMFSATRKAGFGEEVKRRIMLGTYALSAGYYDALYLKAQKIRTLLKRDFDSVFRRCHVLLTPTSPTPAFRLGEKSEDTLAMYLTDVYTIPVNLAGIPGLVLPAGLSADHLPIGVQLLAPAFHDFTLLSLGRILEKNFAFSKHFPLLSS